jgi:hypothetical protein
MIDLFSNKCYNYKIKIMEIDKKEILEKNRKSWKSLERENFEANAIFDFLEIQNKISLEILKELQYLNDKK